MSYSSNPEPTGPSSNTPPITNTPATNTRSNYSNTSSRSNLRAIHEITPEKLRTLVLDFPPAPVVGQTYEKHNTQYIWNGTHWESNNAKYFYERFLPFDIGTFNDLPPRPTPPTP
jgi:hypothetical protein